MHHPDPPASPQLRPARPPGRIARPSRQPPPPYIHGRFKRNARVRLYLVLAFIAIALVQTVIRLTTVAVDVWEPPPGKGDCLSGLLAVDGDWPVVDCDDRSAAYQVAESGKGRIGHEIGSCAGHPDGEAISGRDNTTQWEVCLIPLPPK